MFVVDLLCVFAYHIREKEVILRDRDVWNRMVDLNHSREE